MPEELWTEVRDIVQEAVPKKKKYKKEKWLSEETLHTAGKKEREREREVKGKGEKIYSSECKVPKNSKERQDALVREQCEEIEENNRMGKTRDLFKKIRDAKGTFHAKMGSRKDRNGMDLTEADDIKKRWQEYTGELYKKIFTTQIIVKVLITHLKPDILECKVK